MKTSTGRRISTLAKTFMKETGRTNYYESEFGEDWNPEEAEFDLFDTEPLEAEIKSISVLGVVEITFSTDLLMTKVFENINKTLLVDVDYESLSENFLKGYEVTSLEKRTMKIQLNF